MHTIKQNSTGKWDVVYNHAIAVGAVVDAEDRVILANTGLDHAMMMCNRLNGGFALEMRELIQKVTPFIEHGLQELKNG